MVSPLPFINHLQILTISSESLFPKQKENILSRHSGGNGGGKQGRDRRVTLFIFPPTGFRVPIEDRTINYFIFDIFLPRRPNKCLVLLREIPYLWNKSKEFSYLSVLKKSLLFGQLLFLCCKWGRDTVRLQTPFLVVYGMGLLNFCRNPKIRNKEQ